MAEPTTPFDAPKLPEGYTYRVRIDASAIRVSIIETQITGTGEATARVVDWVEKMLNTFTYPRQNIGSPVNEAWVSQRPTARAMVSEVASVVGNRFLRDRQAQARQAELMAFNGDYRI